MSDKKKATGKLKVPDRAKNGIKVYYSAEDEHFIRQQARKMGMTAQQYLKWKAARERQGLPT